MSYISYLFSFVIAREVIAVVFILLGKEIFSYNHFEALILLITPHLFQIAGNIQARMGPDLKKVFINDKKISETNRGFKILQISDLHMPIVSKKYVEHVVSIINATKYDVLVFTGDIIDGAGPALLTRSVLLKNIINKDNVYFVPGNHEYYWGIDYCYTIINELGFRILNNEVVSLPGKNISIVGVTDFAASMFDKEPPKIPHLDKDQFNILLAHQPHFADIAKKSQIDLQISGHTHGGQFFPWNLLIGFFQKYPRGEFKLENLNLYVNQGTGFWGPADRLGTRSEITLIELN